MHTAPSRTLRGRVATASAWAVARPGVVAAVVVTIALLLVAGSYGFHRDELYFIVAGQHPALGYPDQPPLTPILSAAAVGILGVSPLAVRILPAIAIGVTVAMTADMARRFGGGRGAQAIAAVWVAASGFLGVGHFGSTTTCDFLAWTTLAWLATQLLAGGDRRLWLALGIVMGLGLENRYLVAFLGAGLGAGVVLARRWDIVRSPLAWVSIVVALLIWAPNLAWQATHGWPQLEMARVIAQKALAERESFLVEVFLLSGSLLVFVPIIGLGWLLVSGRARSWRVLGWAAAISIGLVLWTNGKSYYIIGVLPPLVAGGAVAIEAWLAAHRPAALGVGAAAAASIALMAVVTLPIVPATQLASTPIPELYGEAGEQIGWPELVASVRETVDTLPAEERAAAVILTANYGEASAIALLGPCLPPVYSGHNGYWDWGPPPENRSVAIVLDSGWDSGLGACDTVANVSNAVGVENEEYGVPVRVCRALPDSWSAIWPAYRHLD